MSRIRVSTLIKAPRPKVWRAVRDVGSHVRWMHDAETIKITSPQTTGVGTTFVCKTKVGPLRLSDRMEVVEWRERKAMGIRHAGIVTGVGRFTLRPRPGGTLFTWEERLRFPWWLGGPLTAVFAKPVLRSIWKRNLATLKQMVESG